MTEDREDKGQQAVRRAGMEHKGDFKPAANLLTQLARGWVAGTAGLPGDLEGLARLVNKYTSTNPAVRAQDTTPLLPTSEFYKEWLPGKDEGVGGKELNDLASLFGGAGSTTLARGAVKAGKGALTLAEAAARNAAVPRTLSPQTGAVLVPSAKRLSSQAADIQKALRKGATRTDIHDTYGTVPITGRMQDWVDHLQTPANALRVSELPDKAKALALSEVMDFPELYAARPDMKDLTVILGARGAGGGPRSLEGGRYAPSMPGSMLPRSGVAEPTAGLEAVLMHEAPGTLSELRPKWGDAGKYSLLDHELNHALQSRGRSSFSYGWEGGQPVPWEDRLHEIAASIGALDVPTPEMIRRLDAALPLNGLRSSTVDSRPAAIGGTNARYAARSFFNQLSPEDQTKAYAAMLDSDPKVIKAPGGNWLSGSVEDALKGLKRTPPANRGVGHDGADTFAKDDALNSWIDKQLTRYVKNDMATERDPIRALAERGVLHVTPEQLNFRPEMHGRYLEKGQTAVAQSLPAKTWEGASDMKVANMPAGTLAKQGYTYKDPWLTKVPADTKVFMPSESHLAPDLGFDHLRDELRNATNPASGLPRELLIDPKSLDRLSVPQAVERVAKINAWREAQKIEASQALANNPATHLFKEYAENNPKGLRWVELKKPDLPGDWTTGKVTEPGSFYGSPQWTGPDGRVYKGSGEDPTRKWLQDALKYEGDAMGHCLGGSGGAACRAGEARVFSLRDAKGQPHVTVEVAPGAMNYPGDAIAAVKQGTFDPNMRIQEPDRILQIKGKGNKAPNDEYLPFVQDFVKSGKWSDVVDLQNAGLYDTSKGLADFTPTSFQADRNMRTLAIGRAKEAGDLQPYMSRNEWEDVLKKHLPTPDEYTPRYASGGSVTNPYSIDAAAFHSAVDPLLGGASQWQAHDDSPQKLALQLGNGKTWNVGGGEGTYGSGVYKYDPWTGADNDKYAEALALYNATGLADLNPDNIAVGSGSKADRDNMLESWIGSGGATGALRARARGYDTGESGRVEGIPYTQEEWIAALKQDAPGYDPTQPLYRVRGDKSQMLGKPDSRMFLDAGYQERDGQMHVVGRPSTTYQRSAAAENLSMLSALFAPYAVGTALTSAAAAGAAAPAAANAGAEAVSLYQAAQPYLKGINTVASLAKGNPMGALMGYVPGVDLGLGDFGNSVANSAVKAGLSGGDPLMGAASGLAGGLIPSELKQYLPAINSAVAASKGRLTPQQAISLLAGFQTA